MASSSSATTQPADSRASLQKLSDNALTWIEKERRISRATLAKMPVASGTAFFPELKRKSNAIFFRYMEGWKARSFPEKAFTSRQGTKAAFWNLEAVLNGKMKDVYMVEGEFDACAMVESGIDADSILSAPSASGGESETLGYVLDAINAGLSKAKRFIWCGDQDKAGLQLRATMARILGAARFYYIDWPEGIKDANDYLRKDGPEALHDLITNGRLPWPLFGVFKLSEIPNPPPLTLWYPGFLDENENETWGKAMLLAAGTLSVATGHPGMGKTTLFGQIWQQVTKRYDLVACVASFETRPKPHVRRQLRALHSRKLEWCMNEIEIAAADQWIDDHYRFLIHPERRPDLRWLLDQAEAAVVRHGAKIVQIDPWNRLEASREGRETETEYIGRCLRELYNFAADFNCHVQIIAHPSKTESIRRGNPPELEDIAGSKHWDNMVDQGFVVHRPQMFDESGKRQTYAELHHKKARFDELGYPTKFGLDFDIDAGRYATCNLQVKKPRQKLHTKDDDDERPF